MTRKIDASLCAAIRRGARFNDGNRTYDPARRVVALHGNEIARFPDVLLPVELAPLEFNLAGWNTPTTRAVLSSIANDFGYAGIASVGGIPFQGREALPIIGWFPALSRAETTVEA